RAPPSRVSCLDVLQSDADELAAPLPERLGVAGGLRPDQPAEAEVTAGDRQLVARVVDHLDEPADRRAALVQLPGRVRVARTEPVRDDAARLPSPPDQGFDLAGAARRPERLAAD